MSRRPWNSVRSAPEIRVRVERLIATARLVFSIGALAAIVTGPTAARLDSPGFELLVAYVGFSVAVSVLIQVVPRYLLAADLFIHLVDVAWAVALTGVASGTGSSSLVVFALSLFAAAARWGLAPALVTGVVAVALNVVDASRGPFGPSTGIESMRVVIVGISPLVVASMLGVLASQHRMFRAETSAAGRVLAAITGQASFSDSLRTFMDECMGHVESRQALLAVELQATQGLYLWKATRPKGAGQTTLALEDLAPEDRQIYFAPAPREVVVWQAQRKGNGALSARALGADAFDRPVRLQGGFAAPILERHGVSSALAADARVLGEWRARLIVLAPTVVAPSDLYLFRALVGRVSSGLYHKYLVGRVRSHVSASARARLARELHDGLLQSLIGLEMDIDVLRRQAIAAPVPEAKLRQVQNQLRQHIADVRDSMLQLRVSEMRGTDVLRVIAVLVDRLRRECGVDVHLVSDISQLDCTPRTCKHLAHVVQEAFSNIRKHSGARSVSVTLTQREDAGCLIIEDDGRGFRFKGRLTLEQLEAADLGPQVIKERVRAMGGRLTVESRPGEGARIELYWPRSTHVYGQPLGQKRISV